MSLYPITGHPLLCASGLNPVALEEHASIAERVLGLVGTAYTGADARDAARAVVLQVNDQIRLADNMGLQSETHGIETWVYTGDIPINSLAAEIVAGLADVTAEEAVGGAFPAMTSLR